VEANYTLQAATPALTRGQAESWWWPTTLNSATTMVTNNTSTKTEQMAALQLDVCSQARLRKLNTYKIY
jgi:hypothetical protein